MFRYILLSLIILSGLNINLYSQNEKNPRITFFGGITFDNNYKAAYQTSVVYDVKPSYLVGGEIVVSKNDVWSKYGLGVQYQFNNSIQGSHLKHIFIPVYLFGRFNIYEKENVVLNIQPEIGYNLFKLDAPDSLNLSSEGSLFYSLGTVLEFSKRIQVRLCYSANYGFITSKETSLIINRMLSAQVGYSF